MFCRCCWPFGWEDFPWLWLWWFSGCWFLWILLSLCFWLWFFNHLSWGLLFLWLAEIFLYLPLLYFRDDDWLSGMLPNQLVKLLHSVREISDWIFSIPYKWQVDARRVISVEHVDWFTLVSLHLDSACLIFFLERVLYELATSHRTWPR